MSRVMPGPEMRSRGGPNSLDLGLPPQAGVHVDRAARGDCDHRDPGGDPLPRLRPQPPTAALERGGGLGEDRHGRFLRATQRG
jgi:hypothetical protein